MRLLVCDMLININGMYYVHVCEQARWVHSAGNSATIYVLLLLARAYSMVLAALVVLTYWIVLVVLLVPT